MNLDLWKPATTQSESKDVGQRLGREIVRTFRQTQASSKEKVRLLAVWARRTKMHLSYLVGRVHEPFKNIPV